jgi:hypothetical protein
MTVRSAERAASLSRAAWSHPRGAFASELCRVDRPQDERAQGMPGEGLTHGPPAERKCRRQSPQDQPNIRHSLRDGFTASSALSPGTGFIAPVIARRKCVVASATMLAHCARHQHRDARTTRLGRPHKRVRRRPRRTLRARTATAPRLALRDDRDAPLSPRRDAEDITRFLEKRKRNVDVEARQASSIAAPTRSALQASDLASLKTLEPA